MNFFAHGVMYAIRVDAYEKMQRLDMTFFDNKETGEVMSILNNDTSKRSPTTRSATRFGSA